MKEKYEAQRKWHIHFTWLPVRVINGWRWLCYVKRRNILKNGNVMWHYATIEK